MSYSQSNEEEFILEFFYHEITCAEDITCCDVGAFDGITRSNTRALRELNICKALLIEPVPSSFRQLVDHKLWSDTCLNLAISSKPGEKRMMVGLGKDYNGMDPRELSTLHLLETERWPGLQWTTETVICVPLQSVIPRDCDFLSIDTEGNDFDALTSFDLNWCRPALIMVEHNANRNLMRDCCNNYLSPRGYELCFDNGLNAAWKRL